MSNENHNGGRTAWNVGGAIVGVLLAGLSILGLVQSQSSVEQPQTYKSRISYDS